MNQPHNTPLNADELMALIEERLSEYSIHPQETHEEDCGFWGTEDGEGVEYCNCAYKFDCDQFDKCMPEIRQLILADRKKHELQARVDENEQYKSALTEGLLHAEIHSDASKLLQKIIPACDIRIAELKQELEKL